MIVQLAEEEQRLYSRLYVSRMDLEAAGLSLSMLIKKGWHAKPWQRRGSVYAQQSAYVTAFVVAYARPFTQSHGWPKFPSELMLFTDKELELHGQIIALEPTLSTASRLNASG